MSVVQVLFIVRPLVQRDCLSEEELGMLGLYVFSFVDIEALRPGETTADREAIELYARKLLANCVSMNNPEHLEVSASRIDGISHVPAAAHFWESDLAGFHRLAAQVCGGARGPMSGPTEHRSAA